MGTDVGIVQTTVSGSQFSAGAPCTHTVFSPFPFRIQLGVYFKVYLEGFACHVSLAGKAILYNPFINPFMMGVCQRFPVSKHAVCSMRKNRQ